MKKFRFLAMAAAAVMMLGSCSDDQLKGGEENTINPAAEEGVFFAIQIDLPTSGRGAARSQTNTGDNDDYTTSDGGVEVGKDYENKVGEVIVVLAQSPNNEFIAAATVSEKKISGLASDNSSYQVLSKFSKTQLDAFYSTLPSPAPTSLEANIFVFANPTSNIKATIFGIENDDKSIGAVLGSNSWINEVRKMPAVPASTIAKSGEFLMSNAVIATRGIPAKLDDWRYYTTEGNPFDLSGPNADVYIDNSEKENRGSVKLERAAARFDFRDGSPLRETQPFTYHVIYSGDINTPEAERHPIIDIELINMSLVNVNTKFYPLRRVSNNGEPVNVSICGVEKRWIERPDGGWTGGNYVVDANYQWKHDTAQEFSGDNEPANVDYSSNFFYPFLSNAGIIDQTQRTKWFTALCKDVVAGEDDNPEWAGTAAHGDYKIWTYASENTIAHVEDQINGISTGVVFKGIMRATDWALNDADDDTKELARAITNPSSVKDPVTGQDAVIYQFGGNLYLTWTKMRNAAIAAAAPNIQWVADDPTKPDEGHWVLDINDANRTNSLYVAVFGTGGVGNIEYTYTEYKVDENGNPILDADGNKIVVGTHTGLITDKLDPDLGSANYLYDAWVTNKTPGNLDAYKKAMTDAKISIYQPYNDTPAQGGNGYYVYYYYWNRHNDNLNNGVMGPMEFAVVRNNVYKLAVTGINKLGHPRITENDPEKPTGGTPDEKEDVYITVTAEVLPWVVRVNNIEF